MTKVVVTGDEISRNSYGVIVPCRDELDKHLQVILPSDVWPAIGEVYEIAAGAPSTFRNKYGKECVQITAHSANRVRTSGRLIRPWLESIPGLGSTRAQRLFDEFGDDVLLCLGDIDKTDRLVKALDPKGTALGPKLAAQVQAYYIDHQAKETTGIAEADFLLELEKCGVDDRVAAKKMFRLIGSRNAFDRLMEQPWLAAGIMDWSEADHLGLRLLARRGVTNPKHHRDRLAGACDSVWRTTLKAGDTAMTPTDFKAALKTKRVPVEEALQTGIDRRRIIEAGDLLRAPGAAYLECTLIDRLLVLEKEPSGINIPANLKDRVRACENPHRPLTEEQRRAVEGVLSHKISLLHGGAGTGKTTTMLVVVKTWEALGGNVMLGALSGKASLRLSKSTGKLAQTLARHLIRLEKAVKKFQATGTEEMFPEITNKTLVIIDEASMVDLATFNRLMGYIDAGAQLALVGDVAQLPPVGLGQVFHDLVAADVNVFRLNTPLRQKNEAGTDITNPIIFAAADIREGRAPTLPPFMSIDTGAFHLDVDLDAVESSVMRVLDKLMGEVGTAEILALASRTKTCKNINSAMATRREVNGANGLRLSIAAPFVSMRDPIICTRNLYDEALMNGQIGHVNTLEPFSVQWDGEENARVVAPSVYFDLASAWAITCHRAQGSESRFVVVALDDAFMLTREWLYTAATRATQQVIFVGPQSFLKSAVAKRSTRTTFFARELALRRGR